MAAVAPVIVRLAVADPLYMPPSLSGDQLVPLYWYHW